ncbi:MAG: hypothetical protein E7277_09215 [Lachnospiraceae bacterium]|jgi:hypothetical protein|nr:hypothetical protein [Lachnospiraceae bacterium]
MKVIEKEINLKTTSPQSLLYLQEGTLLFDIETTGFSPKTARLYMIGAAHLEDEILHIHQFLTESKEDEVFLLIAFFNHCQQYSSCVTYNGAGFDIPFLKEKASRYKLENVFPNLQVIDLYKELKPYKNLLKIMDLKQKTVEAFLGIERKDIFTGGELISHYLKFESNQSEEEEKLLLLHNYEDVLGMAYLLSIRSYLDAFSGKFAYEKGYTTISMDYYGQDEERLVLETKLDTPVPVPISYSKSCYYLTLRDDRLILSTQVINNAIRVPYLDYKNYYYLKNEDIAILKSLAGHIDKSEREAATLETAYGKFQLSDEKLLSAKLFEPYIKTVIDLLCNI